MIAFLGLLVFGAVIFAMLHGSPKAPPPETERELVQQGFSSKEAKREARAQRNEVRSEKRLVGNALRTASRVGNLSVRLMKKL